MKLRLYLSVVLILQSMSVTSTSSIPVTESMKVKVLQPKDYAAYQAKKIYKWGSKEQKCLRALWGKESAWDYTAKSPTDDYGIPQRHMRHNTPSQIKDFLSHPHIQIDWGLRYIQNRYESPCGAWNFHRKNNWY